MNLSNRVRRDREPVTAERIRAAHRARREEIRARLGEFDEVWRTATDERLWEEMVYCIFTAGASARMGLGSVEAVRHLLARERGIKGLGYKESSHFLRNVGLRGYAILDKHILRCLAEVGVIDSPQPPTTRARYLATEGRLRDFARDLRVDFDELDLVLWSMKTGEILK